MKAAGRQRAGGNRRSVETSTAKPPSARSTAMNMPCDEPPPLAQAAPAAEPPAPPPQGRLGPPGPPGFFADAGCLSGCERWRPPPARWLAPSGRAPTAAAAAASSMGSGGPGPSPQGAIPLPDSEDASPSREIAMSGEGGAIGEVAKIVGGASGEPTTGGASAAGATELLGGVSIGTLPELGSGVMAATGSATGDWGTLADTGTSGAASAALGGAASGVSAGSSDVVPVPPPVGASG